MIYILELEGGKYYVGQSDDIESRLRSHFNGRGAVWTKIHRPIRVIGRHDSEAEDFYTIETMYKYGIENVRGGSFSRVILTDANVKMAKSMMATQFKLCYKCYNHGHYATECKRDIYRNSFRCTRCMRTSHSRDRCYASTTVDGTPLISSAVHPEDHMEDHVQRSSLGYTITFEGVPSSATVDELSTDIDDGFVVVDGLDEPETCGIACHNDIPQVSWYDIAAGAMDFISDLQQVYEP